MKTHTFCFALAALALLVPAKAQDCDMVLRLHGYLGRASASCGLGEDTAIETRVLACAATAGSTEARSLMDQGLRFAEGERRDKGSDEAWCGQVRVQWKSLLKG